MIDQVVGKANAEPSDEIYQIAQLLLLLTAAGSHRGPRRLTAAGGRGLL
jgi:hypothetical protein